MGMLEKQWEHGISSAPLPGHTKNSLYPIPFVMDFHDILPEADLAALGSHLAGHGFVHLPRTQAGVMEIIDETGHLAAIAHTHGIEQGPAQGEVADALGRPVSAQGGAGNPQTFSV